MVPDLPEYAFSDKPPRQGTLFHVQLLWAGLMTDVLRYEKFGAHGGDWRQHGHRKAASQPCRLGTLSSLPKQRATLLSERKTAFGLQRRLVENNRDAFEGMNPL
jgi:hypothetical protein